MHSSIIQSTGATNFLIAVVIDAVIPCLTHSQYHVYCTILCVRYKKIFKVVFQNENYPLFKAACGAQAWAASTFADK